MKGIPRRKKEEVKKDEKENKDIKIYYFSLALLLLFGIYIFLPGSTILETATDTPIVPESTSPSNTHVPESTSPSNTPVPESTSPSNTPVPESTSPSNTHVPETSVSPKVEKMKIVLLHGNHRCTSCINMEKWIEETIEMYFLEEQKKGKIEFLVLNYQDPENKEVVSRYNEHPWTSIYAETIINGESHITEIEDAWYYQTDREKFIDFMKEYIREAIGDDQ